MTTDDVSLRVSLGDVPDSVEAGEVCETEGIRGAWEENSAPM
jgi:hypothetical protein